MAVVLGGLQQSQEHNGKIGVLGIFDAAKGRWLVTVPGPGKMMLKPANLSPAAADVVTPSQFATGCRAALQAEDIATARLLATAARKAHPAHSAVLGAVREVMTAVDVAEELAQADDSARRAKMGNDGRIQIDGVGADWPRWPFTMNDGGTGTGMHLWSSMEVQNMVSQWKFSQGRHASVCGFATSINTCPLPAA
jgi:hypothetical protein